MRALGVVAAVCVGFFLIFPATTRQLGATLFTPVSSVRTWLAESSSVVPLYLRTQGALVGEVRELKRQLEMRESDAFMRDLLEQENRALAQQLGVSDPALVTAGVISGPSQTPYDTFVIDRGSEAGVVRDALVYVADRIAIGRVVAVYPRSSLVQLISAPGVRSSAYILGPDIFTEAEGMGGGIVRMFVPQGVPLAEGDAVVVPSLGAGVYGRVTHVEALESSPNQYGYVAGPLPLRSIRFVQVGTVEHAPPTYEQAADIVESVRQDIFQIDVPDEVLVGTSTPPVDDDVELSDEDGQ